MQDGGRENRKGNQIIANVVMTEQLRQKLTLL